MTTKAWPDIRTGTGEVVKKNEKFWAKTVAPRYFQFFLQLRLFLFVCPAKPLWSLAPVQPLTMAYNKFRRLVLTCKLPEEVYDS